MSIWKIKPDLLELQASTRNTLVEHLGIEIIEFGDDYLKASMPVDARTHQPMGILHGGASVVLAETVGSMAGQLCAGADHYCVGLDINANHLRRIQTGLVIATAVPVHVGRTTQVWDIRIRDSESKLVCISRLTLSVIAGPLR